MTNSAGEGPGPCAGNTKPPRNISAVSAAMDLAPGDSAGTRSGPFSPSEPGAGQWGAFRLVGGGGTWVLRRRWAPSPAAGRGPASPWVGFKGNVPPWSRPLQGTLAWDGSAAGSC